MMLYLVCPLNEGPEYSEIPRRFLRATA